MIFAVVVVADQAVADARILLILYLGPRPTIRMSHGKVILIVCFSAMATWPAIANTAIVYEKDILPIFEKNCARCHGNGKSKGGVSILVDDMKSDIGRIIIPKNPEESMIYEVLSSPTIKNKMPPKGRKLAQRDIDKVRDWIMGGALFKGDQKAGKTLARTSDLGPKPLPGTWKNTDGKAIKADLIRVHQGKAVLRLPGGRIYHYPINKLSPESQERVKEFTQQGK